MPFAATLARNRLLFGHERDETDESSLSRPGNGMKEGEESAGVSLAVGGFISSKGIAGVVHLSSFSDVSSKGSSR